MPRGKKKEATADTSKTVYLMDHECVLITTLSLAEATTFVKQDDIRTKFGGQSLWVFEKIAELQVEEPNKAFKAAQDLLKQGWSKEEVCKLLSLKEIPDPVEAKEIAEIPTNWMEENRITLLRSYVKVLMPGEDVSKWNKDACKATLNKVLSAPSPVEEVKAPAEEVKPEAKVEEPAPWEEDKAAEQEIKEEAKAQEEQPMAFVPPPLPPDMPIQASPLAPPPMVPPPATPISPMQPPIVPQSPRGNWAPPPIPSPFRSKK